MDAERKREGTRARTTQPTGTQVAEDDDHGTAPGRRRAPPPTKERTTARHALPPPPERNISEQSKHNVCNGLDENHDRTPATCHMVRLGPGAGDKDRRDRHYWATLNHDQKLAEALYGLTRAQEAVRRARAHKALADHAIDDAYVYHGEAIPSSEPTTAYPTIVPTPTPTARDYKSVTIPDLQKAKYVESC